METVRLWNLFPLSAIFRDNSLSNGPVTAQFTFLFNFRPNHQLKQNDSSVSFQNIYESPPHLCVALGPSSNTSNILECSAIADGPKVQPIAIILLPGTNV